MSVFRSLSPLLILAALASPALADKPDKPDKPGNSDNHGWRDKSDKWQDKHDEWSDWHDKGMNWGKPGHRPPQIEAPEIDPGSVVGGMTLLVGGALTLADRRRRTKVQLGVN